MYSINPTLSGKQVKDLLLSAADREVKRTYSGKYKMLDTYEAVKAAKNASGSTPPVAPPYGTVLGIVTDIKENPMANAEIIAYKYDTGDGNLGSYQTITSTDGEGSFDFTLKEGRYYIYIYKDGYLPLNHYNIKKTPNEVVFLQKSLIVSFLPGSHIVMGKAYDAITGKMIENAIITYRKGWNNYSGIPVLLLDSSTGVTGTDGGFKVTLPYGNYTAEFNKNGYITAYVNIISSNQVNDQQNAVLVPELSEQDYRAVLTWGDQPQDLDAHMTGPTKDKKGFHTYFSNKFYNESGTASKLDLDDTDGHGPETITLKMNPDLKGVYCFSIHNYSDRTSSSSNELSMSGAQVQLYRGNHLLKNFQVPINRRGTVWNVFEIDKGVITTLNDLSCAEIGTTRLVNTNAVEIDEWMRDCMNFRKGRDGESGGLSGCQD